MNTIRRIIHHASDGGRTGRLALAAWTLGGGWFALAAIALLLAMEPVR